MMKSHVLRLIVGVMLLALLLSGFKWGCGPGVKYTLTNSTQGTGTVTPASGSYEEGTLVALTATPAAGWVFSGWQGPNGVQVVASKILMNGNKDIKAVFEVLMYPLTVTVQGGGIVQQDQLEPDPDPKSRTTSYVGDCTVKLTPVPSKGWMFDHWEGDLTGNDDPANVVMSASKSVKAVFVPGYEVTITKGSGVFFHGPDGPGTGTVTATPASSSGRYAPGTIVSLTVTVDEGSAFFGWDGPDAGDIYPWLPPMAPPAEPQQIVMDSDKAIQAVFLNQD